MQQHQLFDPPRPAENNGRTLTAENLNGIRRFDTCTIANAIERFGVRLRNEGFSRPGIQCVTGGCPRVLGYAFTLTLRSSDPPITGGRYEARTDWWQAVERFPAPKVAVIQDLGAEAGRGSAIGEVRAAILKAFGCAGVVTNGAARDLAALSAMEFPVFAQGLTVSHSYTHIVDFGEPVDILGLQIEPGDLLYADCHGVLSIPLELAGEIPAMAARIRAAERRIVAVCHSPGFSSERLLEAVQNGQ